MRAAEVLRRLIDRVWFDSWNRAFKNKYNGPGKLVESLSTEERQSLQNLSPRDVNHENLLEEAKNFAIDEYESKNRSDIELRNEKLKFDKKILK